MDYLLHIDKYLAQVIANYGGLSYGILFGVIFMETGLVITPFLPGDSLLFAAGALAGMGSLNLSLLWPILILAVFAGDNVNYWVGRFVGKRAFEMNNRLFKKEHLLKAQGFYEKHGGKAVILARFVPIVRTFAPFVAGVGKMKYGKYLGLSLFGGVFWVSLFSLTGYFFGNVPVVKHNFEYVVMAIVLISLVPIMLEWWKAKRAGKME